MQKNKIIPGTCWKWENLDHFSMMPQNNFQSKFIKTKDWGITPQKITTIYNLAIKAHWKLPASYIAIKGSIKNLIRQLQKDDAKEIAMPWIGCGLGGLNKKRVELILRKAITDTDINLTIYDL